MLFKSQLRHKYSQYYYMAWPLKWFKNKWRRRSGHREWDPCYAPPMGPELPGGVLRVPRH